MEAAHCSECLRVVEERLGYRSRAGEVLCRPCYLEVSSTPGNGLISRLGKRLRAGRREAPGRTIWIPGPGAELSARRNFADQIQRS